MKKTILFSMISASLALASASAEVDCLKLYLTVKNSIAAEQSKVLEIVAAEVSAAPGCACEVTKAAIEATEAKPQAVGAIVEAAAVAAPEQMRLIAQCALALAPDALAEIQAVLAKLDPNAGDGAASSKDAKSAKAPADQASANPLDFPTMGPDGTTGNNTVGPTPGGPGGLPLFPSGPVIIINPPEATDPNAGSTN